MPGRRLALIILLVRLLGLKSRRAEHIAISHGCWVSHLSSLYVPRSGFTMRVYVAISRAHSCLLAIGLVLGKQWKPAKSQGIVRASAV